MSDEDDTAPWESDQTYLKVTLKGHEGYEASWVNIGAAKPGDLRRALVQFFGWSAEETAELTLAQLAFNATQEWHAMNNVGREMRGTRAAGGGRGRGRSNAWENAANGGDTPKNNEPDPNEALLAQIEATESVPALQLLYGENKAMFPAKGDPNPTPAQAELLAAYKAKGKALSAAATK